jgi:membrane-bound serine protease (ClpP class)
MPRHRLLPLTALAALLLGALGPSASPVRADSHVVYRARVDGPITAVSADYLERAIRLAEADGAAALLVELDTPGGDLTSMQDITGRMLNSRVPVVVWVGPQGAQAASAGTFLVLAADAAGMAPRTTIGAASPVGGGGEDLPETMGRKATEDMAAVARGYAARRGPEAAAWAERAVRDAAALSAEEALEIGVVDAVAEDPLLLLASLEGTEVETADGLRPLATGGAALRTIEPTAGEALLGILAHPAVALLLLTLGLNAILIELSNPGGFVAGLLGLLALVLGFYSLGVLEANLLGLVFLATALALFVLEVKAPAHGLMLAAGVASFIAGGIILFAGGPYGVPWATIAVLGGATAVFFSLVVRAVLRAQRRPATTGTEGLIGSRAEVRRALAPEGMVFVHGELWTARTADGSPAPAGGHVRVLAREGATLVVAPEAATPSQQRETEA